MGRVQASAAGQGYDQIAAAAEKLARGQLRPREGVTTAPALLRLPLPAMAQIVLRHLIDTPVRYQGQFEARPLEDCRLDHALYALPGPTTVDLGQARAATAPPGDPAAQAPPRDGEAPFQVLLDVVQFLPEDIIIQTFEGWLLVKAQHGTRMDEHGFVSRSFTRQYRLPAGIETKDLAASLCHDGILVVEAKRPGAAK